MIIGITGGIATGKSAVSDYLKEKGCFIIDSDVLAHEALIKTSRCYKEVISKFDCLTIDGEIDRKKLGKEVFNNKERKKELENIIHPYVFSRIEEEKAKTKDDLVFVVMPLLFECGYFNKVDSIICVVANEDVQIKRLMDRDNIDFEYAKKKISNQMPLCDKASRSDYIIDNSGSISETYIEIDNVLAKLKKLEMEK